MIRYLLLGVICLTLAACAPAPGGSAKMPAAADLQRQLQALPGAEIIAGPEELAFRYPQQRMFGPGAVLPLPGGSALLDPLADFLKKHPQSSWRVDLPVQSGYGSDYDLALAEKRGELLASYLLSEGVELQRLSFQPRVGPGEPLTFVLLPPQPAAPKTR